VALCLQLAKLLAQTVALAAKGVRFVELTAQPLHLALELLSAVLRLLPLCLRVLQLTLLINCTPDQTLQLCGWLRGSRNGCAQHSRAGDGHLLEELPQRAGAIEGKPHAFAH
jgi:hypothetical protein